MAQYNKTSDKYLRNNGENFEVVMLSDKDGNIINTAGSASNIPIASGDVEGYSHINKFGYNDAIGASLETIWDQGGLYSYASTAGTLTVTSSSTDSGLSVEVQGLDSDYLPLTETIVASSGGTVGTEEFNRVFRALVVSDADSTNADDITITGDSKTLAKILEGNGQTLMSIYTVPANKTAYFMKFQGSVDAQNAAGKYKLMVRPYGSSFNIKGQFGSAGGNPITYDYPVPLVFTEKSDIEIRATSGNNGVGSIFDLILVDDSV